MSSNLKLPMAHTVLQTDGDDNGRVVLCHLPDDKATPFATWRVGRNGHCYWGHYHTTLTEAAKDFNERSGEQS